MLADYHVHTGFSDDSTYLLEQVVKDAIALGLNEICLTDHVDYGVKVDWDSGREIRYRNGEPLANVDYPLILHSTPFSQLLPFATNETLLCCI